MYYLDASGKRVYTLKVRRGWTNQATPSINRKSDVFFYQQNHSHFIVYSSSHHFQKENPAGKVTESAHPARFSPDDKFSAQRVACKKRFGLYLPATPQKPM